MIKGLLIVMSILVFNLSNAFGSVHKQECISLKSIQDQLYLRLKLDSSLLLKIKQKKEIKIAVIDTGLNSNITEIQKNIIKNINSSQPNLDTEDDHGHGSNITGLILAMNPSAKITELKYYSNSNTAQQNIKGFENAIEYAVNNNYDIVNISGGGAEEVYAEKRYLRKAEKKGIIVVSAAGNENNEIDSEIESKKYYPASYNLGNIFVIMNNNDDGNRVSSSNYGKKSVDISALGDRVYSFGSNRSPSCESNLTGTSQSAPIITGFISLLRAHNPSISIQEIRQLLIATATKSPGLYNKNKADGYFNPTNFLKKFFEKY